MVEAIVMPMAATIVQPGQTPEPPSTISIPMKFKPNPQQVGELLQDLCTKQSINPSQIVSIQIRHLLLGKEIFSGPNETVDNRDQIPNNNVVSLDKRK